MNTNKYLPLPETCETADGYVSAIAPSLCKRLPDEEHASTPWERPTGGEEFPPDLLSQTIYVTETFLANTSDIYGGFSPHDDEYPAMGITIQGAPVFIECIRYPDVAVVRRRSTDEVHRGHPAVGALWQEKLREYDGKCRISTTHIHPMNFPTLSGPDVANFDSLRLNPDDPSTFEGTHPYPVVLLNLAGAGNLEVLGFWVADGRAHQVEVKPIRDDSPIVEQAWRRAKRTPYFSEEGVIARSINHRVSKEWEVELGVHPRTGKKAIKARRRDGQKVLLRFDSETPLGLSVGGAAPRGFRFENYFDWTRLFEDLAECNKDNSGVSSARASRGAGTPGKDAPTSSTAGEEPSPGVPERNETEEMRRLAASRPTARRGAPNDDDNDHATGSRFSATA